MSTTFQHSPSDHKKFKPQQARKIRKVNDKEKSIIYSNEANQATIRRYQEENKKIADKHGFSVKEFMEKTGKKPMPTNEDGVVILDPSKKGWVED